MDSFKDCGMVIPKDTVVIDIDKLPKDSIKAMIDMFNIKTQITWTERGAHLWFKKPVTFKRRRDGVCKLGFPIEQHTETSRPNGMTVKRNGIARQIDNENQFDPLPDILTVPPKSQSYDDMTGMEDGEGRNKALFLHRKKLKECPQWEQMLDFINRFVFAEPLPEDEFKGIVRNDVSFDEEKKDRRYEIADEIIQQYNAVLYSGVVWWYKNGEFIYDEGNRELIRIIYSKCPGKDTRYVDEVLRQVKYRSEMIPGDKAFPIRFKNGVVIEGEFIPTENYLEFTPYYIKADYKPDAAPIKEVDDYIDSLTGGDPDYRKLLMEVMGYVMITDPEQIRALGKFFMFRGDGRNGKGTLLQIMKHIYNSQNCTTLSIKQLTDDRFKVTMIGKLANLGDDIEADAINNNQLKVLKNISTADAVSTRRLYSESISTTFTAKLYFTTNTDIKSFEKGYAYRRRVLWLPMFNKVEKVDPKFITKMTTKEATEYWIRLLVEGYQRLYKNGKWTHSEVVEKYNNRYHEKNNLYRQFVQEVDFDTDVIGNTINKVREIFNEWVDDDVRWSTKLLKEACWEVKRAGIGVRKLGSRTQRVFMYQDDTDQDVKP